MPSIRSIPILKSTSNSDSYHNSTVLVSHPQFATPVTKYLSSSPNQHIFRPSIQPFHYQYNFNCVATSSYYPQQQTPLFYHPQQDPSNIYNKRYGEPPAPPMKRFRYNINAYQHY